MDKIKWTKDDVINAFNNALEPALPAAAGLPDADVTGDIATRLKALTSGRNKGAMPPGMPPAGQSMKGG